MSRSIKPMLMGKELYMTKTDVKGMKDLVEYALSRVERSVRRNDPVAAAYWADTAKYAEENAKWRFDFVLLRERAVDAVALAVELWKEGRFMPAALLYSKAKWLVIIGRNLGFRMPPLETGVNLSWLRDLALRKSGSRPERVGA